MEKVKIGMIGLGNVSRLHVYAYEQLKEKAQIVAICDVSEEKLKQFSTDLKVERCYTDYRDLVRDPSVDVVDIMLPHYLHKDVAIAAAEVRKHILIEKPIARTLEEADEIIASAKENGVKLTVIHDRRYTRTFSLAKQMINRIGEPYAAICEWRFYGLHEVTRGFRAKKEEMGGGILIDHGWHAIDLLGWLVGEVKEVYANWSQKGLQGRSEGEDTILCLFKHKNGALSELHCSWGPGPAKSSLTIYGQDGTIEVNSEALKLYLPSIDIERLRRLREYGMVVSDPFLLEKVEISPYVRREFRGVIDDFLRCVMEDGRVPIPGEEARKNLAVILAAYRSATEERPVKILEMA